MARYRLGSICQIISGSTPKTGVQEYWNGDKKWITPAELSESDYIIYDTERKLTEAGVRSAGLTPLPKGTVILSSRAPIGKVAIAGCEMYCNQGFKNFVCSNIINNKYLYWYLKSKTDFLNSLGRGATFKEISKSTVADIELDIPELSEQSKRVAHLEKIQSIIASRRVQLTKLDELVKCRFVEMFGVIIPDNTYVKLGDVCDIERGGSPRPIANYITNEDNGINWIKIGDTTTDRYIRSAAEKIRPEGARKSRFVYEGDLLLSNSMSFGHPFILKINGCIHDGWLVLHFEKSILNTIYLQSYLSMPEVYNIFSNMAVGGVVNNLNKDMVKKLPILVPPMSLQEKFETFVQRIDKLRFK
ncbi:MAG: restriction endonuclease subunit S [Akkermansia sp.]|nr:restriction endonuclease subunit S [Akkermansia sp.]